jgi:hypothetical protein
MWITARKLWKTREKQPVFVEKGGFFVDKPLEKQAVLVEKFRIVCGLTGAD